MLTNYGRDIILDTEDIDDKDPTGKWLLAPYDPSFVGCLPFDPIRHYLPKDSLLGNGESNDQT